MGFPLSSRPSEPTATGPRERLFGLSPRLAALARLVPSGVPMADVGTDHALLPAALLAAGHVPRAVGVDRAEAPLASARRRWGGAIPAGLALRRGVGLEPLAPGEATTVVLAGFGAKAMRGMLARDRLAALGVERVVTQPTAGLPGLRAHLAEAGWLAVEETIVREGRRGFISSAFVRGPARALDPLEALVGQVSRDEPLLRDWLEAQLHHLARVGPSAADLRAQVVQVLDGLALG